MELKGWGRKNRERDRNRDLSKDSNKVGKKKRESQQGCNGQERGSKGKEKTELQTEVWERGKGGKEVVAGSALIIPAKLEFSNSE